MKQNSRHDRLRDARKRLDDRFARGLGISIGVHFMLIGVVFAVPGFFPDLQDSLWGSPNASGGIRVNISDLGGIPLPPPDVVNETAAANDSEGFFESEPPPPAPDPDTSAPEAEAEAIPETPVPVEAAPPLPPPDPPAPEPETEPPPAPTPTPPARTSPEEEPPDDRPDNAIPFGEGGQVDLPFGQPGPGDGTGMSVGDDGAFGDQYARYVESIQRRISQNWIQGRIDANVRSARRVYVAFNIERDGSISDVRIEETSGNNRVDASAQRAVVASNPLTPLPRDYRGTRVSVRFWFDLRR